MFLDLNRQKQAEEDRLRLYNEAESANNELKNFAYMVSHDFRSHLISISYLA